MTQEAERPCGQPALVSDEAPAGLRPSGFDRARWQPIETAPRDGTPIIGGFFRQPWAESHRTGDIVKCWYQPDFEAFISSCREMQMHNGYTFEDGSTRQLHSPVIETASHWMPLPPAPGDAA